MGIDFGTPSSDGWSMEQQKALSLIPHITGSLSILGSAFIIFDVASDRRKWSSTYHRLLLGMGIYDFISSFATSLSTIPMPQDSGPFSYGNIATCTAQGMFVNLNIASPLCNLMLSIYFLLTVTFRWRKDDVKKKVEIWLHGIPLFWSFLTTLVVLTQDGFNDSSLWCWINSSPKGCPNNPDVPCERCPHCEYFRWFFFFGPLWIAAFGTMVAMCMLVRSVREVEKKAERWKLEHVVRKVRLEASQSIREKISQDSDDLLDAVDESGALYVAAKSPRNAKSPQRSSFNRFSFGNHQVAESPSRINFASVCNLVTRRSEASADSEDQREARRKASRMTSMVAGQAFRYCFVFWVTWLPGSTNRILQLAIGKSYFWVMFLHVIFTPMQGFWNFIVYIDLRVRKWWKEKRRERAIAKEIESLKLEHGAKYDPSIHSVSAKVRGDDDEDDLNENDL